MTLRSTSASPAGHGAPKATEPLRRTGDSMGTAVDTIRNISHTSPYTLPLAGIYCYNGCVSGTWWSATAKSGRATLMGVPFPCTMTGCHHVASFSEGFYAVAARFFDQKNYVPVTHIVSGHSFRLLRPISTPTENAPLARQSLTSLFDVFFLEPSKSRFQTTSRQNDVSWVHGTFTEVNYYPKKKTKKKKEL